MATIPVKRLGKSELTVSRLALGTMNFGAAYLAAFDVDWRQEDEEVIDRLVARCSTAAAL